MRSGAGDGGFSFLRSRFPVFLEDGDALQSTASLKKQCWPAFCFEGLALFVHPPNEPGKSAEYTHGIIKDKLPLSPSKGKKNSTLQNRITHCIHLSFKNAAFFCKISSAPLPPCPESILSVRENYGFRACRRPCQPLPAPGTEAFLRKLPSLDSASPTG